MYVAVAGVLMYLCVGVGVLFVVGRIWVMQCVVQCVCCSMSVAVVLYLCVCVGVLFYVGQIWVVQCVVHCVRCSMSVAVASVYVCLEVFFVVVFMRL